MGVNKSKWFIFLLIGGLSLFSCTTETEKPKAKIDETQQLLWGTDSVTVEELAESEFEKAPADSLLDLESDALLRDVDLCERRGDSLILHHTDRNPSYLINHQSGENRISYVYRGYVEALDLFVIEMQEGQSVKSLLVGHKDAQNEFIDGRPQFSPDFQQIIGWGQNQDKGELNGFILYPMPVGETQGIICRVSHWSPREIRWIGNSHIGVKAYIDNKKAANGYEYRYLKIRVPEWAAVGQQ